MQRLLSEQEDNEKFLNQDIIEHLKRSEEDIKNGRTIPAQIAFKELREKYGY